MFGELFYTPVYKEGAYVGRFLGWGSNFDGQRTYTIALVADDNGNIHGLDYQSDINFPELAKGTDFSRSVESNR